MQYSLLVLSDSWQALECPAFPWGIWVRARRGEHPPAPPPRSPTLARWSPPPPALARSSPAPSVSACRHRARGWSSARGPPAESSYGHAWPSGCRSSAAAERPSSAPGTQASCAPCWPPAWTGTPRCPCWGCRSPLHCPVEKTMDKNIEIWKMTMWIQYTMLILHI